MKKVLFGIFAHPDDEAFGPAGTLLKLKSEGYDIHLMLLTDGEAGVNIDNVPNLAATRLAEWKASATIIEASHVHALHYPDGALEMVPYSELDEKIGSIITKTIESLGEQTEVSCMTFEPQGLTGHRDHIAASELTTRIAKKIKAKEVWYYCLDVTQAPLEGTKYYEPHGREDSYITTRIDVGNFLQDKYRVMDAHVSQRTDAAAMKKLDQSTECFHVETY